MHPKVQGGPMERGGRRRDAGFTMIELLVTIVLVNMAFVTILQAMAVSIRLSDLHRQQAEVEAVITSALERIKETPRVPCAPKTQASYVAAATGAATAEGWSASTVVITDLQYWDGTNYGTTCYDTGVRPLPLQKITVVVTHPRDWESSSLTLVKGVG